MVLHTSSVLIVIKAIGFNILNGEIERTYSCSLQVDAKSYFWKFNFSKLWKYMNSSRRHLLILISYYKLH